MALMATMNDMLEKGEPEFTGITLSGDRKSMDDWLRSVQPDLLQIWDQAVRLPVTDYLYEAVETTVASCVRQFAADLPVPIPSILTVSVRGQVCVQLEIPTGEE